MKIFLYGPPASGKSTLAPLLAKRLGVDSADLDELVVAEKGASIPEIFAAEGELGFRSAESAALKKVAADPRNLVVALGGGTLLDEGNRALCEGCGAVICLDAPDAAELNRRLAQSPASRPLGDQSSSRAEHYAAFPCRVTDFFEVAGSLVVVGSKIAEFLVGSVPKAVDDRVASLYAWTAERAVSRVNAGEGNKTLEAVAALWRDFAASGLTRKDVLAVIGGGVSLDLAGFAAATFMRGIDWISVPTTLLAMVDASIGGKTGFDLPEGKNMVGAFHPPKMTVVDTAFLDTLDDSQLAQGRAEMVKHEIIGGVDVSSIAANLRLKAKFVEEDLLDEKGVRAALNCGHTVAHALERISGYEIPHGEAVALGCVAEARFAEWAGLAEKGWSAELEARFRGAMRSDKKREGVDSVFALPCGWGKTKIVKAKL